MKTLSALALVASMAAASATTAVAMTDGETISMGRAMLTGAIYNSLTGIDVESGALDKLTLGEVAKINSLLTSSDESEGARKRQIKVILDRAETR